MPHVLKVRLCKWSLLLRTISNIGHSLLGCSVSAERFGQLLLEFSIYLPGYFVGVVR